MSAQVKDKNGVWHNVDGYEVPPIDATPTQGSSNAVSSGGTFDAINSLNTAITNKLNGEIETRAKVSAHNFLIFDKSKVIASNTSGTWASNVYTINGGTITLSDIGEIVVNGVFTARSDFAYTKRTTSDLILAPGNYKLVGGISDNISVNGNCTRNGAYYNLGADTGSGLAFTITSDDAGVGIFVRVLAGTYDNVKVSPMITAPNDFAGVFTPYAKTNRELTEDTNAIEPMLNVLGAKNLLPNSANCTRFETVNGGSTLVENADGSITMANSDAYSHILRRFFKVDLKPGTYKFSTKTNVSSSWNGYLSISPANSSAANTLIFSLVDGKNEVTFTITQEQLNTYPYMFINQRITENTSATTYYPMIRLASIEDDTYIPYVMTNQTLMNKLSDEAETRARLGAHNLLPNQVSTTTGNVTGVTLNGDGTVTIAPRTGIPSGDFYFSVRETRDFFLPNGTYIMSGGRNGNIYLGAGYTNKNGGYAGIGYANANDLIFTVDGCNLRDDGAYLTTWLTVNGDVSSELTIYPMIRLASDSDPTYQPYAMTNKELTPTILTATLSASATTVSFTNAAISSDKMIDVYTNMPGLMYTDISVSGNTLTLTYEAQSVNVSVKLLIH